MIVIYVIKRKKVFIRYFATPKCFELRPGAGDLHICWFNFDALAQGNAYKPTKEPINNRGSGGDRTHDLQTKATPPVVQHVRFTPLELCHKNTNPMTCPRLHWTTENPSGMHRCQIQHLCVNFELRPGAGIDLPICLVMILRIGVLYFIIIIKLEVWPICHCLGLGHERMVCAVCLSILLWWSVLSGNSYNIVHIL